MIWASTIFRYEPFASNNNVGLILSNQNLHKVHLLPTLSSENCSNHGKTQWMEIFCQELSAPHNYHLRFLEIHAIQLLFIIRLNQNARIHSCIHYNTHCLDDIKAESKGISPLNIPSTKRLYDELLSVQKLVYWWQGFGNRKNKTPNIMCDYFSIGSVLKGFLIQMVLALIFMYEKRDIKCIQKSRFCQICRT